VVLIGPVVRENPEVESNVENDEPHNNSDDCRSEQKDEEVPRSVPYGQSEPLRPDFEHDKEQEQENSNSQIDLRFELTLLDNES